jgi:hypothetical protein
LNVQFLSHKALGSAFERDADVIARLHHSQLNGLTVEQNRAIRRNVENFDARLQKDRQITTDKIDALNNPPRALRYIPVRVTAAVAKSVRSG